MKLRPFYMLGALLFSATAFSQPSVYYVDLSGDSPIEQYPIKEYVQSPTQSKADVSILLYPDIEFQKIDGIGGTFNEIGGAAIMSLPEAKRVEVMQALFGEQGANFAYCRTAIGSSDFGISAYSYCDKAEDYQMESFSIERERTSVIPYIKMAVDINPKMKLFGSPWSPPGWMKHSGYMDRGTEFSDQNYLKDEPRIYEAYAKYFRMYVQAYAAEGITVDRIVVQNEQDITTKYPSCVMPVDQMYKFISQYLRPEFNSHDIKSEIWAGTFRTAGRLDALEFVSNPAYLASVDGIGIQYTTSSYINDMNQLIGCKATMHTESKCYNGQNSIEQAFTRLGEVAGYINYGIPNFSYWNMILDETTQSGWGWKQNSLINIDKQTGEVTYNPDFSVFALLGKYIQPGAVRVASASKETTITVKDGGYVYIFVVNDSDQVKNYECRVFDGQTAIASVPAKSVAAIKYLYN